MILRVRVFLVVCGLIVLFFIIFALDFYFLSHLYAEETNGNGFAIHDDSGDGDFEQLITRKAKRLRSPVHKVTNPLYPALRERLIHQLRPVDFQNFSVVWQEATRWPRDNEIYPEDAKVGRLIRALQTAKVIKAYNSKRGTQLKLALKLEGSQVVLLKPAWYERETVIDGVVYSGKDRHNSEILAFYLGAVLNLRWTPIVVGRRFDMKELFEKADQELRQTMLKKDEQYCVYGRCFYCNASELVCGAREHNLVEAALLFLIPGTMYKIPSPWRRTYKAGIDAPWQRDSNYCASVRRNVTETRLLDIVDTAIFDFLIQNGDRHRHETRNGRIVLLDNGKGFGTPYKDFLDILAPFYQCCIIRKSTWKQLMLFTNGKLTELLNELTREDLLYPVLSEAHIKALDRRLLKLYATVEYCVERNGKAIFK